MKQTILVFTIPSSRQLDGKMRLVNSLKWRNTEIFNGQFLLQPPFIMFFKDRCATWLVVVLQLTLSQSQHSPPSSTQLERKWSTSRPYELTREVLICKSVFLSSFMQPPSILSHKSSHYLLSWPSSTMNISSYSHTNTPFHLIHYLRLRMGFLDKLTNNS